MGRVLSAKLYPVGTGESWKAIKKGRNTVRFGLWSDHSGSQVETGLEGMRLCLAHWQAWALEGARVHTSWPLGRSALDFGVMGPGEAGAGSGGAGVLAGEQTGDSSLRWSSGAQVELPVGWGGFCW